MRRALLIVPMIGLLAVGCADNHPTSITPPTVPPKPALANGIDGQVGNIDATHLRGVHYFPGWRNPTLYGYDGVEVPGGGGQNPWDPSRNDTQFPRMPLYEWGYQDQLPEFTDIQILSMIDAGFDYAIYQQTWSHDKWEDGRTGTPTQDSAYNDYAVKNHVVSRYGQELKFAVMWADGETDSFHNGDPSCTYGFRDCNYWLAHTNGYNEYYRGKPSWTIDTYLADFEARVRYWFTQYVSHTSSYQFYQGRPLFFFWAPQNMQYAANVFGQQANVANMIAYFRSIAAQYGYSGATRPYIVATHLASPASDTTYFRQAQGWGFDAISVYQVHVSGTFADVKARYQSLWNQALTVSALDFFVPLSPGLDCTDPTRCGEHNWANSDGTDFESLADSATKFADRTPRTGKNIVVCCWNEWDEGPFLQTSAMYGYLHFRGTTLSDAYRRSVLRSAGRSVPFGSNSTAAGNFEDIGMFGPRVLKGWTLDPDAPNSRSEVAIFAAPPGFTGQPWQSNLLGYIFTAYERSDVNNLYGIEGAHEFRFEIPAQYCGYDIWVYYIDTSGRTDANGNALYNGVLYGSPKRLTC